MGGIFGQVGEKVEFVHKKRRFCGRSGLDRFLGQGVFQDPFAQKFQPALRHLQGAAPDDIGDGAARQFGIGGDRQQRVRLLPQPFRRQHLPPELQALLPGRHREIDHRLETPGEGLVDVGFQVGREDHRAREILDALQQIRDFLIRIAVVRGVRRRPLAEQGVRLVEEEDPVVVFRQVEHVGQVLLGLAHILGDEHRKVHPIDVQPVLLAQQGGRQRLTRPRRAVEQRAVPGLHEFGEPPPLQDVRARGNPRVDLVQIGRDPVIQDHILPFQGRGDAFRREIDRIIRPEFRVRQNPAQELLAHPQLPAEERLPLAGALDPQDVLPIQPMVLPEQADHLLPFLRILAAEDEGGRLPRRQEARVRKAFPAAEFRVLASEILVLREKDIQVLRREMRHQREHDHDPLRKRHLLRLDHPVQPPVLRYRHLLDAPVRALLLEIKLDRRRQHLVEPSYGFLHIRCLLLNTTDARHGIMGLKLPVTESHRMTCNGSLLLLLRFRVFGYQGFGVLVLYLHN